MKKLSVAALAALCFSGSVAAEGYFGVSLSNINTDFDFAGVDFDTKNLQAALGNRVNKNFAVEGRLSVGVADDDIGSTSFETPRVFGFYAKAIAPIGNSAEIYGLLGFSDVELEIAGISDSDSDTSIGAGVNFSTNSDLQFGLEYMSLYSDDDISINALNIGLTKAF